MAMVYNPATGKYEDNGLGIGAALKQSANDLGTIVRGGLQGVGNAVGGAVVAPLDLARSFAAESLGGDPNNLSGGPLTDQAFGLMDQGFADAGAAANRFGTGLRNTAMGLVGAVNAPPVVAPPPAPALVKPPAPAVAPANPQTPVGVPDPATGVAPLTARDLAPANVAIANGLAQMQAPARDGVAGAPGTDGVNFGFGVNGQPSAREVLAHYAQQDAQARLNQNTQMDRAQIGSLMSAFNDPFAKTQDKKFIMQQLGLATGMAQRSAALSQGNNLGTMDLTGRQVTAQAALANQRAIATERTQAALQAANLTGNYGLAAAQIKADATKATAKSTEGTQRLANQKADAQQSINTIVADKVARGEITALEGARILANSYDHPAVDLMTGAYIPQENQALLQEKARLAAEEDLARQRAKNK